MAISMYSASVPIFVRMLRNVLGWLDKAEAHARQKGFEPGNYLGLRLAPDMHPFARQIQIASDACKGCVARLAGVETPAWPDDEKTLDELRARIRKTIEYAQSLPEARFEGSEQRQIALPIPGAPKLDGESFLKGFSLPNFFFHVTMIYALLRQGGVELGKRDYIGAP